MYYGDETRWFLGTVVAVSSQRAAIGKAKVRIHGIHGPDVAFQDLPWADCMLPTTESAISGIGKVPQVLPSSTVFGIFADGALSQSPIILGTLNKFERPSTSQKRLASLSGNAASLSDNNVGRDGVFIPIELKTSYREDASIAQKRVIIMQFFVGNRLTPVAAAGIVGNLQAESALDPSRPTDVKGEDSWGLAQWNNSANAGYRQDKLRAFATLRQKQPDDFFLQLEFILHELRGEKDSITNGAAFASTYAKLINSTLFEGGISNKNSTWAFLDKYENPSNKATKLKKREEFARLAFEDYNKALTSSISGL